ncbi:MAG: hypothetical protein HQL20_10190 [Candidatus Omnitrophica bacterium]|nr:hypothetical protein [Candidatus Omnitrophota bacterium]
MVAFYIMGGILLAVVGVLGWLLVSLKKLAVGVDNTSAVPVVTAVESVSGTVGTPAVPVLSGELNTQIEVLQQELVSWRERSAVLARDFTETVDKLKAENEILRADKDKLQELNARLKDEDLAHYKAEGAAYKMQVDSGLLEIDRLSGVVSRLQEDNSRFQAGNSGSLDAEKVAADIRAEYQSQLAALDSELCALRRDNSDLKAAQADKADPSLASSALGPEAFEALKEDLKVLSAERDRLAAMVEELEENSRGDQEKHNFLVYELTKSRAHALGIERICDNARLRFEGLSRENYSARQDRALVK